jgi:surface polysaccharide O-acyltransferase-like enzyme
LLHVTGHVGEIMNYNIHTIFSIGGIYETFANNFFRIGVDLFLMISGALLLGRNWDVKGFFEKRIPRIAIPFLFWSLIFSMVLIVSSYLVPGVNFVEHFEIMDLLAVFVNTLLFKAPGSVVYWFFWMMLGVYILMPLFNRWINGTDFTKIEYFLIIWTVYLFFVYTLMVPIPVEITFFLTPMGFVVLGYYLRYTEREIFKNRLVLWSLVILPSIIMILYAYTMVEVDVLFIFQRYSVPVMLVAVGIFCLFKNSKSLNSLPQSCKSVISSVALCSYGMYLIHSQIIMIIRKIIPLPPNYVLDFIVLFIGGFVFSWIIIYILAKIPIIDEFIGVK